MYKKLLLNIGLGCSLFGFSQKILTDSYQPPQTVANETAVRMLPGFHANSNDGNYTNGLYFRAKIGNPETETTQPVKVYKPSLGENFVYSRSYLAPVTESNDYAPQMQNIQYFDGLGRPKQNIAIKVSPTGKDLVTPIVYDEFGRQRLDYLPIPQSGTTNGQIYQQTVQTNPNIPIPFPVADLGNFYKGELIYSEKKLENSPLDRLQQKIQVGNAWQNNPVTFDYETNSGNEVLKFGAIDPVPWKAGVTNNTLSLAVGAEYYPANQLYKNKVTDEDGNISYEFKNGEGQTLLVRKMEGPTSVDTYYVYNEYNLLTYVLSPLASDAIKNNLSIDLSLDGPTLSQLCYQYRYDGRGRLAEKRLPGKGWEYMVYDQQDRLVLTQDANLRLNTNNFKARGWLFTKYDQFGRLVYTGFFPNVATRESMQNALNSMRQNPGNNEERTASPTVTLQGMPLYYNNQGFPTGNKTLLSVNYYDSYPSDMPSLNTMGFTQTFLSDNIQDNINTKSMSTASYVKNIEDHQWTKNYSFYDGKGRTIGVYSVNHLGGFTKTENFLDFAGIPQQTYTYHKRTSNDNVIQIKERFVYNAHNNALEKHYHEVVGESPEELLTENTYNEIGQLKTKKVGNNIQEINYAYNIRGWLTGVNNPANIITMGTDLFAFTIRYTDKKGLETPDVLNNPSLKVKGRYNGNIAEVDWNAVDEAGTPPLDAPYRYGYVYDGLNRLRAGFYQDPGNPGRGTNNEIIEEYDLNGNIKKLKRFAWRPKSSTPAKIDDLDYIYSGNKVTNIADTGNGSGYEGGNGLIEYDVNGNMYKMPDKGIKNITYNHLNLPTQITQQNITQYLYRADGAKLRKSYTINNGVGSNTINTEYLDGFQYVTRSAMAREALKETDDHTLAAKTAGEEETFVNIDALIDVPNPTDATMVLSFFPTAEGFYDYTKKQYIYQYKDHLGNVRLSYAKNTVTNEVDILDRNDFYPFGMNFVGYHSVFDAMGTPYNYKYNGKELQETGMYDYGARMYMPDIGRWGVVDKLSEFAQSWSPYRYAYNNPIQYYDPTGLIEEGGPGDPKKKEETRTQNIEEVVVTKYRSLSMKAAEPTFGDHLQSFRNAPPTASYGAGNGMSILSKLASNIILDTGNALKNFIGIGRYQGGPAGEQWTRLDGFPMGGEEQQTQAVNMLLTLFGGQYGLAAKTSAAAKTPSFKSFSGTKKAWQSGATPNSIYTYLSADGETAVSNYIYNAEGKVSFQVDFQNHGIDWLSGHGHNMTIPGKLGSGHLPENHILHNLVPADFKIIPTNTTYSVPLAK